jgi:hypothetical protein
VKHRPFGNFLDFHHAGRGRADSASARDAPGARFLLTEIVDSMQH